MSQEVEILRLLLFPQAFFHDLPSPSNFTSFFLFPFFQFLSMSLNFSVSFYLLKTSNYFSDRPPPLILSAIITVSDKIIILL